MLCRISCYLNCHVACFSLAFMSSPVVCSKHPFRAMSYPVNVYCDSAKNRQHYFDILKMLPLFRAVVKFYSTNRLFMYCDSGISCIVIVTYHVLI